MIELILKALAVGAGGFLGGAVAAAGTDAYNAIKKRLFTLFKGNAAAVEALTEHEKDPEGWEKPLETYLKEILGEKVKPKPSTSKKDYSQLTVAELKTEFKKRGVKGYSGKKKAELIKLLKARD